MWQRGFGALGNGLSSPSAGGLAAVVYTDVLQAVVLLVGSCLVAWLSFAELDFSWARLVDTTPPERLSLMLPLDDPNLPWLGTLVGVPILGFYFWCTNQFIVQRVLGARSIADARRGALFAGLLKLPVLFLMVLPGVMAGVFLPGLEQGDQVFPALIGTLLPPGLAGLVLAALVAAKLEQRWSPEQITGWLKRCFPHDVGMQVSHESIYRTLFVQSRGALRRHELTHYLRTRRVIRRPKTARQPDGRGGLARVFYGSVAAGILQRIDRPLLIIRARDEG